MGAFGKKNYFSMQPALGERLLSPVSSSSSSSFESFSSVPFSSQLSSQFKFDLIPSPFPLSFFPPFPIPLSPFLFRLSPLALTRTHARTHQCTMTTWATGEEIPLQRRAAMKQDTHLASSTMQWKASPSSAGSAIQTTPCHGLPSWELGISTA